MFVLFDDAFDVPAVPGLSDLSGLLRALEGTEEYRAGRGGFTVPGAVLSGARADCPERGIGGCAGEAPCVGAECGAAGFPAAPVLKTEVAVLFCCVAELRREVLC